ncbi:MAG TPA: DUF1501 domain-containing protein [Actinopolymorphaceae bacterium]|jgi:uncharacterized protein (DUF1501 family)
MPLSSVTRRRFLTYSGVAAAGALAVGATQVSWLDLIHAAERDPLDPTSAVLVVVTLYGGNDGLNTVVPAGDKAYQSARPDLAYQPNEVLDLGDGLGLNPGMTGLHKLWNDRQLAIVRGVGYPQPDHSHFRSMAIWQTASPQTSVPTGWLGRWLDRTGDDPIRAVSIDPVLPPMLAGEKTAAASCPVSGLVLPPAVLGTSLSGLGVASADDGTWQARVAKSYADLGRAAKVLGPAVPKAGAAKGHGKNATPTPTATPDPDDPDAASATASSAGGTGGLARQLDVVASLVEAGVPTRAYSVSLGGFDTHADERATQQRLLGELDQALSGFAARLATTDRGKQVVTLVYSEFGRRVTANASEGTDHGTAGPVFVLGKGVLGGFHGDQPSLTDLDDGDLKAGTDFRDVYASVLQTVLGADPGAVLDGHTGKVDKLFAA